VEQGLTLPAPRDVNPTRLTIFLENAGWRIVGARRGIYNRFAPPGEELERDLNLVVPVDAEAPEYEEQMSATLHALRETGIPDWAHLVSSITRSPADQYRFLKETAAPSGFIQWSQGERMFDQVKSTLVAGAKAHVDPAPYFANRLGQFVKRFMDTALMGQTESGSYVVTAFVPVDEVIPLHSARFEGFEVSGATTRTRAVTESILQAIGATSQALQHYHSRNSYAAFENSVNLGVSFEMLHSLAGLAEGSDGAEVAIELEDIDSGNAHTRRSSFAFRPTDAQVLRSAGDRLLEDFPARTVTVVGRVHLLRKDTGEPGLIGIEWTSPVGRRRLRVKLLDDSDYNTAVQAHLEGRLVQLSGSLIRLGRRQYLLDNARLDAVIDGDSDSDDNDGSVEDLLF
jgi:hypothetical protein